MHKKSFSPTYR